jgi:hypothetical protein
MLFFLILSINYSLIYHNLRVILFRGTEPPMVKIYVSQLDNPAVHKNLSYLEIQRLFRHQYYSEDEANFDIGLIKMKKPIEMKTDKNEFLANTVCLPVRGIVNTDYESAVVSAYGTSYSALPHPHLLQVKLTLFN